MRKKALVWKLFPVYFLITLLSMIIVATVALNLLREFYYTETEKDLEARAMLISQQVKDNGLLLPDKSEHLKSAVKSLSECCDTRITVITPDGNVIADSEHNPSTMENHSDRPEIQQAANGKTGSGRHRSPTLGITMVYVAVPVKHGNNISGIVRVSLAATAIDAEPTVTYYRIILGTFIIAALAGVASLLAAKRISKPLLMMKNAAAGFADGNFKTKVPLTDTEEMASLADTLNRMASQLDHQLRTITQQASEQHAIMSSMNEGVIAIDNNSHILMLNPMAEELLGIKIESARGKHIHEVVRNVSLQNLFVDAGKCETPVSDELQIKGTEIKLVQATGASLLDSNGKRLGVLVVLNNITQTRKLETIRKDFVANVSHELKTPITSIKGFVETLRDGAIDDPVKAKEFLDIVARQADRLNSIIEDLLTLSRMEQKADDSQIAHDESNIKYILTTAAADCRQMAQENNITVIIDSDEKLAASVNAPLLEQAVSNLLDNAIKYSPAGSNITITAAEENGEIAIHVIDSGPGIEQEHLHRLFERFYRVDKARSRKMGGTGLGLSIVKHIVNAHNGRVDVKSFPGKGSTFSIYIPSKII